MKSKAHPEQRFWQALRNFVGGDVFVKHESGLDDTYYWENKND